MAWSAPMTAVANTAFTAAQFNQYLRDNLNETAPAKATTAGRIFVATGTNAIAERAISGATTATAEGTTSTSYTDLATAGPAVTVTTGTQALIFMQAALENNTAGSIAHFSYAVTGASAAGAADSTGGFYESPSANDRARFGVMHLRTGLTAGSNVFTMKYRASANTATFRDRHIAVIAL